MMTLVSTFLSFLAGGLPKILTIFQDWQDKKHEFVLVAAKKERMLASVRPEVMILKSFVTLNKRS